MNRVLSVQVGVTGGQWGGVVHQVAEGRGLLGDTPAPPPPRLTSPCADCAELQRAGYTFQWTPSRHRLQADSVAECSSLCRRESHCHAFSYRAGRAGSWGAGRAGDCHLSERRGSDLSSADLRYDRDWDIYRPVFSGGCSDLTTGGSSHGSSCFRQTLTTSISTLPA